MKKLLIIFSCFLTISVSFAGEWNNQINFYFQTERAKINDTSWDGYNSSLAVKSFFVNFTTSPPDIMICIVDNNGTHDCHYRLDKKNKAFSLCHNSFDCEFFDIKVPDDIFGVLVVDLDEKVHDLIDGVILTKEKKGRRSKEVKAMNQMLNELCHKVAPALTPGEKHRRERPFQVFVISDCADGVPCSLRQSQFEIFSDD